MLDKFAPFLVGIVLLLAALGIAAGHMRTLLGPVRASRVMRLGRTGGRLAGGLARVLYRTMRWAIRGPSLRRRKVRRLPTQANVRLRRQTR